MASIDNDLPSKTSIWRRTPSLAKAILVIQMAVIVYMATWISLEYQNNQYLQSYVQASLSTNIPTLQTVLPIFLATGTITVYARLLTRKKDFAGGYSQEEFEANPQGVSPQIIPYPDEFIGQQAMIEPLPQLESILVSKKRRREAKGRRKTSRNSIEGRSRKTTRRPDSIQP